MNNSSVDPNISLTSDSGEISRKISGAEINIILVEDEEENKETKSKYNLMSNIGKKGLEFSSDEESDGFKKP